MIVEELGSEKNHFYRLLLTTSKGNFKFSSESYNSGKVGNFKLSYKPVDGEGDDTHKIFYSNFDDQKFNSLNSILFYLSWNLDIETEIDKSSEYYKVKLVYSSPLIPLIRRSIIFEHTPKGGILLEVEDSSIFSGEKVFYVNSDYMENIRGLNFKKIDDDDLPIGLNKLQGAYRNNKLQFNMKYDE